MSIPSFFHFPPHSPFFCVCVFLLLSSRVFLAHPCLSSLPAYQAVLRFSPTNFSCSRSYRGAGFTHRLELCSPVFGSCVICLIPLRTSSFFRLPSLFSVPCTCLLHSICCMYFHLTAVSYICASLSVQMLFFHQPTPDVLFFFYRTGNNSTP